MVAINNNINIQNSNLEKFISLIKKAEAVYLYEPEIVDDYGNLIYDKIEEYTFNGVSLSEYSNNISKCFDSLKIEINTNIANLPDNKTIFLYLLDLKPKISVLSKIVYLKTSSSDISYYYHQNYKVEVLHLAETSHNIKLMKKYNSIFEAYFFYVIEALSFVNNLIDFYKTNPNTSIHSKPKKVKSAPPVSFIMTLLNERDTHGFWQSLVDSGFIKRDINNYDNFMQAFTNTKVNPKIVWYGDKKDLYHLFIKLKSFIENHRNSKSYCLQNSFIIHDDVVFDFKKLHSDNGPLSVDKENKRDSAISKLALQC